MLQGVIGVEGKPKPEGGTGGTVWWRWVTPEYFSALRIPLVRGEGFTAEEQDSNGHFMVLSKMLAERMFPGENPIGQHLKPGLQGPWYTVVGVAANVKNGGLSGEQLPELYRLRRNRASYLERYGQAAYDMMLGDCLWHIYQMIGKLSPRIYLLKKP